MGALLGDEVVYADAGALVFKPRDQWHTFWNAGDGPCRILEIISPGGFEHLFREMAEGAKGGGWGDGRRDGRPLRPGGRLRQRGAWLIVHGLVNAAPDFGGTAGIVNGFSDLILDLYGPEAGTHARTVPGVATLPLNHAVFVGAEVEVRT